MRLSGRKASSHAPRWSPPQRAVLLSLIGVNVAAFLVQQMLEGTRAGVIAQYLGLSYRGIDQACAWQFFSAMFLHAGLFSFVGSMIILYLIGRDLEVILGQKHFLYLYFGGLLGGELGHFFLLPETTVLLAASGGVAALVVAFATILPDWEMVEWLRPVLPVKLKAKYFAWALAGAGTLLMIIDRHGVVGHSAWLGGCVSGWFYAHLLGFGRPSFVQRSLHQRRLEGERRRQMPWEEFIAAEIDPLLEKISRSGLGSLSRGERRTLARVREKMAERPQ
jgi:membrane associated rhomboid family serine protease